MSAWHRFEGGLSRGELVIGVAEEDETENGRGELGRLQARICPELVRRRPQPPLDVVVRRHGFATSPSEPSMPSPS